MPRLNKGSRAGYYEPQSKGYEAFIPHPPPKFSDIEVDDEFSKVQSLADRAVSRLDGAGLTLPNPDLFVSMYVFREAVDSSRIEGTEVSLMEALEAEAEAEDRRERDFLRNDVREVDNYIRAMNYGLRRLDKIPVSLRLLKEIHKILLSGVRGENRAPGQFRRMQNCIGSRDPRAAEFVPPPPGFVSDSLSELETFLHQDDFEPALVNVGIAHAQFETIHPFIDGNGRLGRLLVALLLCDKGVLTRPLLYISDYLKRNRSEYFDRLQRIRDHDDWEGWLKFFLQGIHEVADEAAEVAHRIVMLRERHQQKIQENGQSTGACLRLLNALYQQPVLTVKRAQEMIGMSYASANRVMKILEQLDIVGHSDERKRNIRYVCYEYIDLFY